MALKQIYVNEGPEIYHNKKKEKNKTKKNNNNKNMMQNYPWNLKTTFAVS